MQTKDCFFIVGNSENEQEKRMQCACVKCVKEKSLTNGWFWEGSKRGYGKFVFKCEWCGDILYQPENHVRKTN